MLDRLVAGRGGLENWAVRFAAWLLRRGRDVHGVAFEFDEGSLPPGSSATYYLDRRAASSGRGRWRLGSRRYHPLSSTTSASAGGTTCSTCTGALDQRPSGKGSVLHPGPRLRAWADRLRFRRREDIETRQYAPGAGRIVAVSRMVKTHLIRDYAIDPARIDVVWNGVDATEYSPEHRRRHRDEARRRLELDTTPTFLFIGHNYYLKGLPVALRALAQLARGGSAACLCVVGNGPTKDFAALADRLGVASGSGFSGVSAIRGRIWRRRMSSCTLV